MTLEQLYFEFVFLFLFFPHSQMLVTPRQKKLIHFEVSSFEWYLLIRKWKMKKLRNQFWKDVSKINLKSFLNMLLGILEPLWRLLCWWTKTTLSRNIYFFVANKWYFQLLWQNPPYLTHFICVYVKESLSNIPWYCTT